MEMPVLVWSVLYYLGLFAATYIFAAIGFMIFARLEKDESGSLVIDPNSLHYRVCSKVYEWEESHIENFGIGICGYFWRVFWAFILLPIGYIIFAIFQMVKTIIYAPFMFLFGYYPWPTIESVRYGSAFAVEARRISFPRVGKLELKPYTMVFPVLYGWLLWSYLQATLHWTYYLFIVVVAIMAVAAIYIAIAIFDESKNQRVTLVREYFNAKKRGICPLLKVKRQ